MNHELRLSRHDVCVLFRNLSPKYRILDKKGESVMRIPPSKPDPFEEDQRFQHIVSEEQEDLLDCVQDAMLIASKLPEFPQLRVRSKKSGVSAALSNDDRLYRVLYSIFERKVFVCWLIVSGFFRVCHIDYGYSPNRICP